jgi:hypothetical protein
LPKLEQELAFQELVALALRQTATDLPWPC